MAVLPSRAIPWTQVRVSICQSGWSVGRRIKLGANYLFWHFISKYKDQCVFIFFYMEKFS
jgi:hypothetical protein